MNMSSSLMHSRIGEIESVGRQPPIAKIVQLLVAVASITLEVLRICAGSLVTVAHHEIEYKTATSETASLCESRRALLNSLAQSISLIQNRSSKNH
jgi:hypothetical protein